MLATIDMDNITEDEFLEKAIEIIGPLQKTKNKTLAKDTFIKVFRMTGEFAKLKSREQKKLGQEKRILEFGKDHKKYLATLKQVIMEEEKAYEASSMIMFDKLCITPECFERTQ